jgi:multicomponent Na+:H+ antiporter subunit G
MGRDVLFAAGLALLAFGLFVFFSAVLGLFRFHSALNRMHAAAVGDALGIFCVLAGLCCLRGAVLPSLKLGLVLLFLWLTSPVASHLLAEMELNTNPEAAEECEVEHL